MGDALSEIGELRPWRALVDETVRYPEPDATASPRREQTIG